MNGLEMKGLCFGCDVYAAENVKVASISAEGETCEVTLKGGVQAVLYFSFPFGA